MLQTLLSYACRQLLAIAAHHCSSPLQVWLLYVYVYATMATRMTPCSSFSSFPPLQSLPFSSLHLSPPPSLPPTPTHPQYAYYTECDQIVRYDSLGTLFALSTASNATTFFSGRRREKSYTSNATDYMGSLDSWRECGTPGFSMSWPQEKVVRKQQG